MHFFCGVSELRDWSNFTCLPGVHDSPIEETAVYDVRVYDYDSLFSYVV